MATLTPLRSVFDRCQRDPQSHEGLRKKLKKLFDKRDDLKTFFDEFITCLNYSLCSDERGPALTLTLDFAAQFVATLRPKATPDESDTDSQDSSPEGQFEDLVWEYILKGHNGGTQHWRQHLCYLVARIFASMEDVYFSETLFARLQEAMLKRLNDKVVAVRVQAARAMHRLQDSANPECTVASAYIYHLTNDPSYEVRLEILNSIYLSKRSLPAILGRTRDVKDVVRKAAYELIAKKMNLKILSLDQKTALLKQGLIDRSDMVKVVCKDMLLPRWFELSGKNIPTLMKSFDVLLETDLVERMCRILFETKQSTDLVAEFTILDENRLPKVVEYRAEAAFYWRVLCQFLKTEHDKGTVDLLSPLLPDLPRFCTFIKEDIECSALDTSVDDVDDIVNAFTSMQYLHMTELYDYVDESEKKCLHDLINMIMTNQSVHASLVPKAAHLLKYSMPDAKDRCAYLLNLIPAIREDVVVTKEMLTPSRRRAVDVKMAKVKVQINVSRDALEKCVEDKDFVGAQRLQETIASLESELANLTLQINPQIMETLEEKDDDNTMFKCISIFREALLVPECKMDRSTLLELVDHLVLPCIKREDVNLRLVAVHTLGVSCLHAQTLAKQHFCLILQISQLDTEDIRVAALNAIFDILLLHRFDIFSSSEDNVEEDQQQERQDPEKPESSMIASILKILVHLLNSEYDTVRETVALGLCKLLLTRRILSPKIFSRLLIMWFNPVNADFSYLKSMLGSFLTSYGAACSDNREVVSKSIIPILRILTRAPHNSPLSGISIENVCKFLLELTIPPANEYSTLHNELALEFCKEILKDEDSELSYIMVKALPRLALNKDRYRNIKELDKVCRDVLQELSSKDNRSKVRQFQREIQALLEKVEYSTEDEDEDEEEEVTDTNDSGVVDRSCEGDQNEPASPGAEPAES